MDWHLDFEVAVSTFFVGVGKPTKENFEPRIAPDMRLQFIATCPFLPRKWQRFPNGGWQRERSAIRLCIAKVIDDLVFDAMTATSSVGK